MKNNPKELQENQFIWQIEPKLFLQNDESFVSLSPETWTNQEVRLVISVKKEIKKSQETHDEAEKPEESTETSDEPSEERLQETSEEMPEEISEETPGETSEEIPAVEPELHVYVATIPAERKDERFWDLPTAQSEGLVVEAVCEENRNSEKEPSRYTVDFPARDFSGVLRIWAVEGEYESQTCEILLRQQVTAPQAPEVAVEGIHGKDGWYVEKFPLIHVEKTPQKEGGPEVLTWMRFHKRSEENPANDAEPFTENPIIEEDGIYELSVYAQDTAGNRSAETTHTIAVATQKPKALFWTGEPQQPDGPGGYFRSPVVLRGGAQFGIPGGNLYYRLSEGDWQVLPDRGLLLEEDGRYEVEILAEDAAGNQNRVQVSPMIIDRAFDFFVVEGVKKEDRFSADMEITIRLQDVHYKESRCFLQQRLRSGALQDVSDHMEEVESDDSGRVLRLQLAQEPMQDGCYFLRVCAQDRAGNVEEQTFSFLVNRFGSLYFFDESTLQLQNRDVQVIRHPLIVTEYNPDVLVPDGSSISLWRDGQRIFAPRMERVEEKKSLVEGEAASWRTYRYTLSPENFRQDGAYRVLVSSTDATGNISNSEQRAGRLTFRVDTSPPELTVRSVTDTVKKGEEGMIRFCATDHMGLDAVSWALDGRTVQTVQNFTDPTSYEDVFSFIGDGGDHTIRFRLRDRAGNESEKNIEIRGEELETEKGIKLKDRANENTSLPRSRETISLSPVTAQARPKELESKEQSTTNVVIVVLIIAGLLFLFRRGKRKSGGGRGNETRPL